MPRYYLRIEAVNFDYSVYDTNDISTIRGGSSLILDAFNQLKEQVDKKKIPVDVISSAASEVIISFEADEPTSTVEDCLKTIPEEIREFATIVHAVVKVQDQENVSFNNYLERLKSACRRQQYQTWSFVIPEFDEKVMEIENNASTVDGVRPGIGRDKDGKIVSESVQIRRKKGKEYRQKIYERILGRLEDAIPYEFTDDLEQLSSYPKGGSLDGKIAFIYLDGNRFGKIRKTLLQQNTTLTEGEKALQNFQNHIQNTMRRRALEDILKVVYADEKRVQLDTLLKDRDEADKKRVQREKPVQLETLLWGGDEIEWVVPAWLAWKVLTIFFSTTGRFQRYEEHIENPLCLTHAAGVVFCHYKLPVLQVRAYARQLCDLAKKKIPKEVEKIQDFANCFAFLNMTSFDLLKGGVGDFLRTYHAPASPEDFVIQADEMRGFDRYLPVIKTDFPRRKLFDITAALKKGKAEEVENILKRVYITVGKEREKRIREALRQLLKNRLERWFVLADLIDYIGEDEHWFADLMDYFRRKYEQGV